MTTDRIEKNIMLRAPIEHVWRAISDPEQFGRWFGVRFDGPFASGTRLTGRIVPTTADSEVAKLQEPHEGKAFEITIGRMEPMRYFSFRWHPFAVEPEVDYSNEPTTLVEFTLEEQSEGVLLTVTESGFDQIPIARRARAFTANEAGWSHQIKLIEKYLIAQAAPQEQRHGARP